ncbi:YebC/PmpR family DNA-binding transcriptional regulator [Candidatus Gottesmanbacteria bacterium]|nr:YebC/PmpR family DNA-binding transcriptional regulator [Candidatus Gottesmanbacteria bacterium]
MSGHSKWSQIKRQKGLADAKRGQIFTKLGNALTIAVKEGGGIVDPESNFKLRLVIEIAKQANMPKENIQRALDRALGKGEEGELEEVFYEGFGPQNISVMVEAVTDNRLRTQAGVKNFFDKSGGRLGSFGSVSYLFQKSGLIIAAKEGKTPEEVFLLAADLGAKEVEEGEEIEIYTKPGELHNIKKALEDKGIKVLSAELIMKPTTLIEITNREHADKIISFLAGLEDLDDVQKVYSNVDILV